MTEPRFLYNVDRAVLDRLLALEKNTGEPFTATAAAVDLLLALDAERVHGQRTYARRWGWTYKTVRHRWGDVTAEAARLACSDGRQPGGPLARKVPPAWLENAGLDVPRGAQTGQDRAAKADQGRTSEPSGAEGRTQGRTWGAPRGAQTGPDGAVKADEGRTQGRTWGAPRGAHLSSLPSSSPHPSQQPTNPTARAEDATGGAGSVGRVEDDGGGSGPNVADVVGTLRAAGESDPNLDGKVRALIAAAGPALVRRQLDGIVRQQDGKPFGFGFLKAAVDNPQRFTFAAVVGVEVREGERYSERERERAVEAGAPPEHFQRAGFDDRNRPEWLYLPGGPRKVYGPAPQEPADDAPALYPTTETANRPASGTADVRSLDALTADTFRPV